jgi:hypothetical protein
VAEADGEQGTRTDRPLPSVRADKRLPSRHVEMEGRSWTIVDLEDGLSWNLYANDPRGRGPAPRLAHITISELGYYSSDPAGVVRGPYTTLDEAAYPLALDKRVLLDDPVDRAPSDAPVPPVARSGSRAGLLLLLGATAVTVVMAVVIASSRRGRPTD